MLLYRGHRWGGRSRTKNCTRAGCKAPGQPPRLRAGGVGTGRARRLADPAGLSGDAGRDGVSPGRLSSRPTGKDRNRGIGRVGAEPDMPGHRRRHVIPIVALRILVRGRPSAGFLAPAVGPILRSAVRSPRNDLMRRNTAGTFDPPVHVGWMAGFGAIRPMPVGATLP